LHGRLEYSENDRVFIRRALLDPQRASQQGAHAADQFIARRRNYRALIGYVHSGWQTGIRLDRSRSNGLIAQPGVGAGFSFQREGDEEERD
jgi:hypothetical protein